MSTDQRVRMVTILVRLADLEFLSPHDLSGGLSTSEIVDVIRKQFGYLPGEVDVEINDCSFLRRTRLPVLAVDHSGTLCVIARQAFCNPSRKFWNREIAPRAPVCGSGRCDHR